MFNSQGHKHKHEPASHGDLIAMCDNIVYTSKSITIKSINSFQNATKKNKSVHSMILFELLNARSRATTAESSYPIVRRTTAYRNKAHLLHRAVYIGHRAM